MLLEGCTCACRTGAAGCRCSTELEPASLQGLEGGRVLEGSDFAACVGAARMKDGARRRDGLRLGVEDFNNWL